VPLGSVGYGRGWLEGVRRLSKVSFSFFVAFMPSFFSHLSFMSFLFLLVNILLTTGLFNQEFKNFLKQHEPVIVEN